jgi:hypothetical protein
MAIFSKVFTCSNLTVADLDMLMLLGLIRDYDHYGKHCSIYTSYNVDRRLLVVDHYICFLPIAEIIIILAKAKEENVLL